MSLTFLYWFVMFLMLLLSFVWGYRIPRTDAWGYAPLGVNLFVLILLIIIGLKLFGSPISGG